jgi:phosphohistidine phosphatase
MKIYVVRHAIAVPHGTPGVEEDQRPLTPEGVKKMQKAALGLRALEVEPGLVLSSPLPRARQTAEILVEQLSGKPRLQFSNALAPGGRRADLYEELSRLKTVDAMLVGHQPSLGEIAGEIVWGSAEHYLELKKGGACAIDLEQLRPKPRGTLVWLATPAMLREVARKD